MVDICGVPELADHQVRKRTGLDWCRNAVSAVPRHARSDQACAGDARLRGVVCDNQIRESATIGGNIVNASTSGRRDTAAIDSQRNDRARSIT